MRFYDYRAAVGAVCLWACSIPVGAKLSSAVGAYAAGALVYFIGGGTGVLVIAKMRGLKAFRSKRPVLSVIRGTLFAGYCIGLYVALGFVHEQRHVAMLSAVNYQWPILTLIIAAVLQRTPVKIPLFLLGIASAVAGVLLVKGPQAGSICRVPFAALLIVLGIAVLWALYPNLSTRSGDGPGLVFIYMLVVGTALGIAQFVSFGEFPWSDIPLWLLPFALMGPCAYLLWENAVRQLGGYRAGLVALATPVLSTVALSGFYAELPPVHVWSGMALIVFATLLTGMARQRLAE